MLRKSNSVFLFFTANGKKKWVATYCASETHVFSLGIFLLLLLGDVGGGVDFVDDVRFLTFFSYVYLGNGGLRCSVRVHLRHLWRWHHSTHHHNGHCGGSGCRWRGERRRDRPRRNVQTRQRSHGGAGGGGIRASHRRAHGSRGDVRGVRAPHRSPSGNCLLLLLLLL